MPRTNVTADRKTIWADMIWQNISVIMKQMIQRVVVCSALILMYVSTHPQLIRKCRKTSVLVQCTYSDHLISVLRMEIHHYNSSRYHHRLWHFYSKLPCINHRHGSFLRHWESMCHVTTQYIFLATNSWLVSEKSNKICKYWYPDLYNETYFCFCPTLCNAAQKKRCFYWLGTCKSKFWTYLATGMLT